MKISSIDIESMKAMAEEKKQAALRSLELYLLLCESIKALEGEQNDFKNETGHKADPAMQAARETLRAERDAGMPHEGLPSRMGGVRKGGRGVQAVHGGTGKPKAHPLEVKVVMPEQKPLKIPAREQPRVCETCGRGFTWGESGFKKTCSEACEKERLRQLGKKRREDTASTWEAARPRRKNTLDKTLKELEDEGMTYAEKQKAETIARFAKIDLEGKI